MTITYYTKDVYGKTLMYLANPIQAQQFTWLTGRKTISEADMVQLGNLTGAEFVRVFEPEQV